jgi:hypothetical protein
MMEEIFKDQKNIDLIDKSLQNILPIKNLTQTTQPQEATK